MLSNQLEAFAITSTINISRFEGRAAGCLRTAASLLRNAFRRPSQVWPQVDSRCPAQSYWHNCVRLSLATTRVQDTRYYLLAASYVTASLSVSHYKSLPYCETTSISTTTGSASASHSPGGALSDHRAGVDTLHMPTLTSRSVILQRHQR